MLTDELVMSTGGEICRIDFFPELQHVLVKVSTIGVTDGVSAPQFADTRGFCCKIFFTGKSKTTGCHLFLSGSNWKINDWYR